MNWIDRLTGHLLPGSEGDRPKNAEEVLAEMGFSQDQAAQAAEDIEATKTEASKAKRGRVIRFKIPYITITTRGPVKEAPIPKRIINEDNAIDWRQRGACRDSDDPEIFFSEGDRKKVKMAKSVCGKCVVRDECLNFALHSNEIGIWGATTTFERRRIKKRKI